MLSEGLQILPGALETPGEWRGMAVWDGGGILWTWPRTVSGPETQLETVSLK